MGEDCIAVMEQGGEGTRCSSLWLTIDYAANSGTKVLNFLQDKRYKGYQKLLNSTRVNKGTRLYKGTKFLCYKVIKGSKVIKGCKIVQGL